MKIGFFGDSFCAHINNGHSKEHGYTTYLQMLIDDGFDITHLGKESSSVWDLILLQFMPKEDLPDVCVFCWSEESRLFHREERNLNFRSVESKKTKIHSVAKDYYLHIYDNEKHRLEYQALMYYFDNVILKKYPNKKFIHLWSFVPLHKWETGVEIRPALYEISKGEYDTIPPNDMRANHLEGYERNKLVADAIKSAIENYDDGRLITLIM